MFKKNNERVARNINVQKTTSAKRDVNLIFSKNQYFTKKALISLITRNQCLIWFLWSAKINVRR